MEETVFFNLGNALASSKDEKELIRTAQIEQDTRKIKGLVIVKDPENGEHILFDLSDAEEASETNKEFVVKKTLDHQE